MSSSKIAVWKFEVPMYKIDATISIPKGAKILCVQTQFHVPCIWAECNVLAGKEVREFQIIPTGQIFPDTIRQREYIGTFQLDDGNLVFHLFELIKD